MVSMCQFVQCEVGHPLRLPFEVPNVREFDRLLHCGIAFVITQPAGTRVVLGPWLDLGIFR